MSWKVEENQKPRVSGLHSRSQRHLRTIHLWPQLIKYSFGSRPKFKICVICITALVIRRDTTRDTRSFPADSVCKHNGHLTFGCHHSCKHWQMYAKNIVPQTVSHYKFNFSPCLHNLFLLARPLIMEHMLPNINVYFISFWNVQNPLQMAAGGRVSCLQRTLGRRVQNRKHAWQHSVAWKFVNVIILRCTE